MWMAKLLKLNYFNVKLLIIGDDEPKIEERHCSSYFSLLICLCLFIEYEDEDV